MLYKITGPSRNTVKLLILCHCTELTCWFIIWFYKSPWFLDFMMAPATYLSHWHNLLIKLKTDHTSRLFPITLTDNCRILIIGPQDQQRITIRCKLTVWSVPGPHTLQSSKFPAPCSRNVGLIIGAVCWMSYRLKPWEARHNVKQTCYIFTTIDHTYKEDIPLSSSRKSY